jgi:hypothetical protein
MGSVIHMDTEQSRSVARQLDHVSADIQQEITTLGKKLRSLNWQSPSRDAFVGDFAELQRKIQACAEKGITLGTRVQREVDEWEQAALHLDGGGSAYSNPIVIIGGGALIITIGSLYLWAWTQQNLQNLSPTEAEAKIKIILGRTSAGRNALKKAEEIGIKFELSKSGQGTWYDPDTDTMYVDPNTNPDLAAESYIHELQHAQQDSERRLPDAGAMNREEYIEQVVDIEAEALIKEYEYENERPILDQIVSHPGEDVYQKTYAETLKSLQESNPEMSSVEMHKLAYEAGKEEIKKLYRNGSIITSTTQKSYVDDAGEYWDQVNIPPASETAPV